MDPELMSDCLGFIYSGGVKLRAVRAQVGR